MKLLWKFLEKNGTKWLNYGKKWSDKEMKFSAAHFVKKNGVRFLEPRGMNINKLLFVSDDGQTSVVVDAAGVALVVEGEVVDAVGEAFGVESLGIIVEDVILDVCLVVFLGVDAFPPSVIDVESVGEDGVHVLDGEDVVDAVAVGCHDVGEDEVCLDVDGVADGAGAALVGLDGERYDELAPGVVGVLSVGLVGFVAAVAVVPGPVDHVVDVEDGGVGDVDECDFTALAEVRPLGVGDEVADGLREDGEVCGLDDGVAATFRGVHDELHAVDAGFLDGEGGSGGIGGEHDLAGGIIDDAPLVGEFDVGMRSVGVGGLVGHDGVEGGAVFEEAGGELCDGLRVDDDLGGVGVAAGEGSVVVVGVDGEDVFAALAGGERGAGFTVAPVVADEAGGADVVELRVEGCGLADADVDVGEFELGLLDDLHGHVVVVGAVEFVNDGEGVVEVAGLVGDDGGGGVGSGDDVAAGPVDAGDVNVVSPVLRHQSRVEGELPREDVAVVGTPGVANLHAPQTVERTTNEVAERLVGGVVLLALDETTLSGIAVGDM